MSHPPSASAIRARNQARYELLAETAHRYAAGGDAERTLRASMMAANYAWNAPFGRLADLELERAVVHVVRGQGAVRVDGTRDDGRVLHVMSEAYSTGGHTRLVWRWIERDALVGDLAVTCQPGPLPPPLVSAVAARGGSVHDLRAEHGDLLDRARALRALMDTADLVVLHVHPHDSVALAAVNLPGTRPPVIYENHTDQSFWMGVGAADILCDLRPEAAPLDERLRGVPAHRVVVLPMPVDTYPVRDRDATREALGIPSDVTVALTVSANWKMAPCWGRGMADLADRVLRWTPRLRLVVVGAGATPDWARTLRRHPGRITFTGRVDDPAPYYAMADLYLDSYPLRSPTSALEAAVLGLPLVTLDDLPVDAAARILQANSPGLADAVTVSTAEKVAVTVGRLAADPVRRRAEGARLREAVLAAHDGSGWLEQLGELYRRARGATAADVDELAARPVDESYGTTMVQVMNPLASPDPGSASSVLGDHFDAVMQADAFATLNREVGPSLSLRVARGWEDEPAWSSRLLGLAEARPRLRVSMPFVADDDHAGSRTESVLIALLEELGTTPEGCGDITIEVDTPVVPPTVGGELPFSAEALDWLQGILDSPCWDPPSQAPVHEAAQPSSVLA